MKVKTETKPASPDPDKKRRARKNRLISTEDRNPRKRILPDHWRGIDYYEVSRDLAGGGLDTTGAFRDS